MGLDLEARRKTSGVWANAWGRQPGKSEAGGSGGIVRRGDWWWGEETRKSCPKALQGDPVDDDWSGEAGVSHRGGITQKCREEEEGSPVERPRGIQYSP